MIRLAFGKHYTSILNESETDTAIVTFYNMHSHEKLREVTVLPKQDVVVEGSALYCAGIKMVPPPDKSPLEKSYEYVEKTHKDDIPNQWAIAHVLQDLVKRVENLEGELEHLDV